MYALRELGLSVAGGESSTPQPFWITNSLRKISRKRRSNNIVEGCWDYEHDMVVCGSFRQIQDTGSNCAKESARGISLPG